MTLSLEDRNDLPYLLSLVHDCAEEGDGVAHRLSPLEIALHHRVAVRMAACTHLDQGAQHLVSLRDLMQL